MAFAQPLDKGCTHLVVDAVDAVLDLLDWFQFVSCWKACG